MKVNLALDISDDARRKIATFLDGRQARGKRLASRDEIRALVPMLLDILTGSDVHEPNNEFTYAIEDIRRRLESEGKTPGYIASYLRGFSLPKAGSHKRPAAPEAGQAGLSD